MRILAISGSLRDSSSNTTLILALACLAPSDVVIDVYDELGDLPHFNPDIDKAPLPDAVVRFLARLAMADGVIICSPEYAHGVAGVMKNAIDWTVGNSGLENKPVALVNASPRSRLAHEHLSATLRLLGNYVDEASVSIPASGTGMNARELANDVEISAMIRTVLETFCRAVANLSKSGDQS